MKKLIILFSIIFTFNLLTLNKSTCMNKDDLKQEKSKHTPPKKASHSKEESSKEGASSVSLDYSIVLVEESASSLGIYDSRTGQEIRRIGLSLWPHEIDISKDLRHAYISNFGLRDYDLTIGYAGNSISIIDLENGCETGRLYTVLENEPYWAPHGVKISPDGRSLYVNVERIKGSRFPDPTAPLGQQDTKMLVFDLGTHKLKSAFKLPMLVNQTAELNWLHNLGHTPSSSFMVLPGMHNFVFSPDGSEIWYYSGLTGVTCVDPLTGEVKKRLTDFNGSVRALSFNTDGSLLVSATNELAIVDPKTGNTTWKLGNLGATQFLYSKTTSDMKYILAPAVWEGQVVVVDIAKREIVKRIVTGIDPVQVLISPDGKSAFATHGRSSWLTEINLSSLEAVRNIKTKGGPNGADFSKVFGEPAQGTVVLGACLPFTGENAPQGRECRLGLQHWQDKVNSSGGFVVDGKKCLVEIAYADTDSSTDPGELRDTTQRLIDRHPGIVSFLGSYPPEANVHVAHVANANKIPFLTSTGRQANLFEQGFDRVFGIAPVHQEDTPDVSGVFSSLWRSVSPKPQSVLIVSNDQPFAYQEAQSILTHATKLGLSVKCPTPDMSSTWTIKDGIIILPHGVEIDFNELVLKSRDTFPDLVFLSSAVGESTKFLESSARNNFTPGAFTLSSGVTFPGLHGKLGAKLNNVFGSVTWSGSSDEYSLDRFTTPGDFKRSYYGEYSEYPSELAAGFAGCGVLIEGMLQITKTSDPDQNTKALASIEKRTFFGDVKFDGSGRNTKAQMTAVQFKPESSSSREVIVWPINQVTQEKPNWPFPVWKQ